MGFKEQAEGSGGDMDRLVNWAEDELPGQLYKDVCSAGTVHPTEEEKCHSDDCDDCPAMEVLTSLEYAIHTEAIEFIEKLIRDWREGSGIPTTEGKE